MLLFGFTVVLLKIRQANLKRNHVCLRCFPIQLSRNRLLDRVGSVLSTTCSFRAHRRFGARMIYNLSQPLVISTNYCSFRFAASRVGMAVNWKDRVLISPPRLAAAEVAGGFGADIVQRFPARDIPVTFECNFERAFRG